MYLHPRTLHLWQLNLKYNSNVSTLRLEITQLSIIVSRVLKIKLYKTAKYNGTDRGMFVTPEIPEKKIFSSLLTGYYCDPQTRFYTKIFVYSIF